MKYIKFLIVLIWCLPISAQVKGLVYTLDENTQQKSPVSFAEIYSTSKGYFYADENGAFEYIVAKQTPDTLVISSHGLRSDTLILTKHDRFAGYEIRLFEEHVLDGVVISASKRTHGIDRMSALHVEKLNQGELRKAACCNLSESFETNASVDVNITDAVTGVKQIQMLGLDGKYTQIQFENIPALRGMETPFGLNSIPGTWANSIQITKGVGNVVNGYESMAGLINVEFLKGHEMPPLFVNLYGNAFGRFEANIQSGLHVGKKKKWDTGIFAHYSENFAEIDYNKDGFRDLPVGRLFSFMNRWNYSGEKVEVNLSARAFQETKFGGQIKTFEKDFDTRYGTVLDQLGGEFNSKTGFLFKQPYRSLGLILNYKYHDLGFKLSNANFKGIQNRLYGNLVYDDILGNTNHSYRTGISFVYDDYRQDLVQFGNNHLNDDKTDIVPGAFFEYTFTSTRFTGVAGLRYDYHNRYKSQFSPRIHGKVVVTETTDFRFTAGRGWRTPHFITDNLSLLASNRKWVTNFDDEAETSWNAGASFVQNFQLFKRGGSIVVDYYYTHFTNQMMANRDLYEKWVAFHNIHDRSYSHALQVEVEVQPARDFFIRFAYKFIDAKQAHELNQKYQEVEFVPRHRGFINFAYQTRNRRWKFDLTGNIFGKTRLPKYLEDGQIMKDTYSNIYPMVNGQVTHIYKNWEFYLGIENMTNFKQKNPIMGSENPFGSKFDATMVWGPITGINPYFGIRFTLNKKTETHEHEHH